MEVGVEGTKGLVHIDIYNMPQTSRTTPLTSSFTSRGTTIGEQDGRHILSTAVIFEHGGGLYTDQTYWLFSVIERAKSMDPEKIIKVWEGDTYRYANGKIVKMRACDHKMIRDLTVEEYVPPEQQKISMSIPPYYWYKGCSADRSSLARSGCQESALDGSEAGSLQGQKRLGRISDVFR